MSVKVKVEQLERAARSLHSKGKRPDEIIRLLGPEVGKFVRGLEATREFREAAQRLQLERADSEGNPWEVLHWAPPWHDTLIDGERSPGYGPRSQAALEKQKAEFEAIRSTVHGRAHVGSGGLWDQQESVMVRCPLCTSEQCDDCKGVTQMAVTKLVGSEARQAELYDSDKMRRYVEKHSHEIPERELEVYFHVYRDGRTKGQTAHLMGVKSTTVRVWLHRLRARMSEARA